MGRIHVDAWRAAYRGVMPDTYLDGLSPSDRASMWTRNLAHPRPGQELLVIEERSTVRGFASLGPEEGQPDETEVGEIFGINLEPGAWGRGLGRRLLSISVNLLRVIGYHEAVLWVVPENARARGLYSSAGWAADGAERQDEILGAVVTDIRYRVSLLKDPAGGGSA